MYFYELHEGDEDLYADLILAHEDEFDPDQFIELVQASRLRVEDIYEQDSLIEAIAEDLERRHGFVYVSDRRLTAAVAITEEGAELALVDRSGGDDDDEDEEDDFAGEYRSILADYQPDSSRD